MVIAVGGSIIPVASLWEQAPTEISLWDDKFKMIRICQTSLR